MKNLFSFLLLCGLSANIHAQNTSTTFGVDDNVLGLGVGLGGVYGFSKYSSQTPAIGINFDHGILAPYTGAVVGVGGYLGYKGYMYDYVNSDERVNITVLGGRITFHYDILQTEHLDTYGGAMLSLHFLNGRKKLQEGFAYGINYSRALYPSLFAGAKYYLSDQVAAYMELGYGVSWATVGAAFKF